VTKQKIGKNQFRVISRTTKGIRFITNHYETKIKQKDTSFEKNSFFNRLKDKKFILSFYFYNFVKLHNFAEFRFISLNKNDSFAKPVISRITELGEISKLVFKRTELVSPSKCGIFPKRIPLETIRVRNPATEEG
jgi:hypothetical protein